MDQGFYAAQEQLAMVAAVHVPHSAYAVFAEPYPDAQDGKAVVASTTQGVFFTLDAAQRAALNDERLADGQYARVGIERVALDGIAPAVGLCEMWTPLSDAPGDSLVDEGYWIYLQQPPAHIFDADSETDSEGAETAVVVE